MVADSTGAHRFPAWSSDGAHVAFDFAGDIWVVPATGGTPVQVTTDPANDLHPTWSQDDTKTISVSSQ